MAYLTIPESWKSARMAMYIPSKGILLIAAADSNIQLEILISSVMEPLPTKKGYLPIGRYPIHIVLWFQICFIEKGRAEKFIDANFKSLAHFVDDPEFHRWIGAVDDIGHS